MSLSSQHLQASDQHPLSPLDQLSQSSIRSSPSNSAGQRSHATGDSPASSNIVSPATSLLTQQQQQQHDDKSSSSSSSSSSSNVDDDNDDSKGGRSFFEPSRFNSAGKGVVGSSCTTTLADVSVTTSSSTSSAHTPLSSAGGSGSLFLSSSLHSHAASDASSASTAYTQHLTNVNATSSPLSSAKMISSQYDSPSHQINDRKRKSSADGTSPQPQSGAHDNHVRSSGHQRAHSGPSLSDRGSASSPSSSSSVNRAGLVELATAASAADDSVVSKVSVVSTSGAHQAPLTKRIKTARACDGCRRKKIRCDVVDDGGPILGDPNNGNGGLTCAHCRQYGFECTFFLPITETRFKKKREREAEEMAAAAAAAATAAASRARLGGGGGGGGAGIFTPMMQSSRSLSSINNGMPFSMPSSTQHSGVPSMTLPVRGPGSMNMSSSLSKLGVGSGHGGGGAYNHHRTSHLDGPPVRISSTQEWPRPDHTRNRSSPVSDVSPLVRRSLGPPTSASSSQSHYSPDPRRQHQSNESAFVPDDFPPPSDTRVLGPTSIAYIVHSTAFVPGAAIEEHDLKHHQTFEVGTSGDGIIKFHKPPKDANTAIDEGDDGAEDMTRVPELVRARLAGDVAEKLVNSYFEKLGYLFPVITKSEFLHLSPPPPLMLYAICGVAALSREVPKEVLSAIKTTLNGIFREVDVLSNSNNNNVKAMLIMSLHSDVHGSTAVQAGSRCWNRVGAAVRMAQDLGLHRDASGRDDLDDDAYFLEQKRRIWGCCVTADRCMSISLGHPLAIDLTDCDVRLPSPYEILRSPNDLPALPGVEKPFAFNTEMLKLSILFGRVMKTIYSPTGLMKTTDDEIVGLLNDMDRWKEGLPAALQFRSAKESPAPAGILHISYACLLHLFFRVFMRISYNCPQHLTFSLTIERMTTLIKISRESIDWVDVNDFYLDTLQFVSYGLVFCATVQYHAWIRRGDQEALIALKKASDCVNRFKRQGEQDAGQDLSMRAKTGEVIMMLHQCAIGSYNNSPNSGNLNPTAGVTNRRWVDTVRGIVFKPDQTRPGGGVYVATKPNLMLDDLPQGTMIMAETEAGVVPALVRTNRDANGGWQAFTDTNSTSMAANKASSGRGGGGSGNLNHLLNDASGSGSTGDSITPTNADLTHVAGGVWADAEGRPVDRQGSRLLTMIPVPGGNAMIQSYPGGPRYSFSSLLSDMALPQSASAERQPHADGEVTAAQMHANANVAAAAAAAAAAATINNSAPSSVDQPAWLTAMSTQPSTAATANSAVAPPTFNFSDLYTFDGQIAQPAAMMRAADGHLFGLPNSSSSMSSGNTPALYATSGSGAAGNDQLMSLSINQQGTMQGSSSNHNSSAPAQAFVDPLALDGMPGGPLDFAAWEQWFRSANASQSMNNVGTGVDA